MSEDPATYYIPQARITQNAQCVWMTRPEDESGTTFYGVRIQPDFTSGIERDDFTLVSGVTAQESVGREMVLIPIERLENVEEALNIVIAKMGDIRLSLGHDTTARVRISAAITRLETIIDALSGGPTED